MTFRPFRVVHIDLARAVPGLPRDEECGGVDAVFWRGGVPVGRLVIPDALLPMNAAHLAAAAAAAAAPAVGARVLGQGFQVPLPDIPADDLAEPADLQAVLAMRRPLERLDALAAAELERGGGEARRSLSIIVCTRGRPAGLRRCIKSLRAMRHAPLEILVVDNAPESDAVRHAVAALDGVRYVEEPRPGLSAARNTGIRCSGGDIIAFTDDDVVVHRDWAARLAAVFADPRIMAATGLVLPAELETEAQYRFEHCLGGLQRGFHALTFDAEFFRKRKRYGVAAWKIGAGANMAFRRAAFERHGGFDERLGAGTSGCSEDSEMWYRLLAAGETCRYDPAAVVFHHHRRETRELKAQMYQYMRGHVAALMIQFARHRHSGNLYRLFATLPAHYARSALARLRRKPGTEGRMLLPQVLGCFAGVAYSARLLLGGGRSKRKRSSRGCAPAAAARQPATGKQRRGRFLAQNPSPKPLTLGFFYREKMRAIHAVAPDMPFTRILEVGGGRSGLASLLYPRAEIVTLDRDLEHAQSPVNQRENVRFVCGDATALPFPDESFDAVTMFDLLEHVEDHERAAAEAVRVLRPSGYLLVSSPNESWRYPFYGMLRRFCPTEEELFAEWGHVRRGYAFNELKELIALPCAGAAAFISPITALCHDVSMSRLPLRARRVLCAALSPVTWLGYALHRPSGRGTETASAWQKPASAAPARRTESSPANPLLVCNAPHIS